MSDQFTLDVVQASEIKHAVERNGGTNADLKMLSSGDMFARILPILRGYGEVVVTLLQLVGTLVIPATKTQFVAKDKFKLKKDGGICYYLGDNFKSWFLEKIERAITEKTLCHHKLWQSSFDAPIIAGLGGETKVETTLTEMFSLMEKQKNGESGVLLTNGYANIFYIEDVGGILRAVYVSWSGDGWYVIADSVGTPYRWIGGGQVFSRNPLKTKTA